MRLFVTGGAGFIGSNYARWVLANTDHEVTVYDALTYAGNLSTLRDIDDDPRAMYFEQSHNGMWVRAALLAYLFNVDGEVYGEHEKLFSRRHDYNEAVLR